LIKISLVATKVRQAIKEQDLETVQKYVPETTFKLSRKIYKPY
jgi:Citrate lyase synthetase